MSKQHQPAPTASAVSPCPTIIQISSTPGIGSLPSLIAPRDHTFSVCFVFSACLEISLTCQYNTARSPYIFNQTKYM